MGEDHRNLILVSGIGCLTLAGFPLVIYIGLGVLIFFFDLIPPGVKAGDIDLGWMTRKEAAQAIYLEYNEKRTLLVKSPDQSWQVPPIEFGFFIDSESLADRARMESRGIGGPLRTVLGLFGPELILQPEVLFSEQVARSQIDRWGLVLGYPAEETGLSLVNGKWEIIPGEAGRIVDTNASLKPVLANPPDIYWSRTITLVTQPLGPVQSGTNPELVKLRDSLNRPIQLRAYDPVLDQEVNGSIPASTISQWVKVEQRNGTFNVIVDEAGFSQSVAAWQPPALGGERELINFPAGTQMVKVWRENRVIELGIRHKPTQYLVQSGDILIDISMKVGVPYWKILAANPGLDADKVPVGQKLIIPSKNDMLPLPVVRGKRIVISISQQRMWTYENGQRKKEYIVSTGIDKSPTMPGIFQVQSHEINAYASVWDLYMPNFLGIYEAWPGFMNGIHGLPTLSNGTRLWANVLGRKASYGCIILNLDAGREVYQWAENGVVVEIKP